MKLSDHLVYINGDFVPRSEAKIGLSDLGFRAGYSVYDTERTIDGKVYQLRIHMERFWRSLKYTRLDPGMSMEQMEAATIELARRNDEFRAPGDDYMISQVVTKGEGDGGDAPDKPNVIIWPDPWDWLGYARFWKEGVHLVIPKTRSFSPDMLDPKVKNYNRLHMHMATHEAHDVDPKAQALMLDIDGNISELPGNNFFIVTDGVLRTPTDKSCLAGISRMNVLNLAEQLKIPVLIEDIQPYDVYTADEAFLTNTPRCMYPASKVDNRQIGQEVPGPITKQLIAAWSDMAGFDFMGQIERREREVLATL